MQAPIVIVGSGLAGYMAAKELRKLDKTVPITIVTANRGDFYSKPLLSTALTQGKTAEQLAMQSADAMATQLDARIVTQKAVKAINPADKTIQLGGELIQYDRLVLALGAKVRPLSFLQGDAVTDVYAVNDLEAYAKFREFIEGKKKIAILGTGLVGCEFASDLHNAGYEVIIIAPEPTPLALFVPEQAGQYLKSALQAKGIRWYSEKLVTKVDHAADGYQVTLGDGQNLVVDGVLAAIGITPSLDLAQAAGLKVNQGIVVDQFLRTSDPYIYALGDCAEVQGQVRQYVAPILQCSRVLAKTLSGNETSLCYPCMPILVKTPACPVVACPPSPSAEGSWHFEEGEGKFSALYYSANDKLLGFVLMGDAVRDKVDLVKKVTMSA